jgi:nicotinamidase-related amidase
VSAQDQPAQPETSRHDDLDARPIAERWGDEVADFYSSRGFGNRVGFGRHPAVLVVDMMVAFTDPSYGVGVEQAATVDAIAELLAAARDRGLPVYYTRTAYERDGRDGGVFMEKVPALRELVLGSPAVEIDPGLAPAPGEPVILKKFASAFHGTNLLSLLVGDGVDTLILTGCTTSGCIRAAAVDGISYGFRVVVPESAVSDRAAGPHWSNLFDINAKYGDVLPLSEVLEELSRLSARA